MIWLNGLESLTRRCRNILKARLKTRAATPWTSSPGRWERLSVLRYGENDLEPVGHVGRALTVDDVCLAYETAESVYAEYQALTGEVFTPKQKARAMRVLLEAWIDGDEITPATVRVTAKALEANNGPG